MTDCGCGEIVERRTRQRQTLRIALVLNATMFVVGMVAGFLAQSNGLIADALDMLADASAYTIALLAIERDAVFKARTAALSGAVLMVLGGGVLLDAFRRGLFGSLPEGVVMIAVAVLSLGVNMVVLFLLARHQQENEVHLRATYIFTRADVMANLAVIVSGAIVSLTHLRYIDLIVGAVIGTYVMHEALEILSRAREAIQNRK